MVLKIMEFYNQESQEWKESYVLVSGLYPHPKFTLEPSGIDLFTKVVYEKIPFRIPNDVGQLFYKYLWTYLDFGKHLNYGGRFLTTSEMQQFSLPSSFEPGIPYRFEDYKCKSICEEVL